MKIVDTYMLKRQEQPLFPWTSSLTIRSDMKKMTGNM